MSKRVVHQKQSNHQCYAIVNTGVLFNNYDVIANGIVISSGHSDLRSAEHKLWLYLGYCKNLSRKKVRIATSNELDSWSESLRSEFGKEWVT